MTVSTIEEVHEVPADPSTTMETKRAILHLAQSHQYQLHPSSLKLLLETLTPIVDSDSRSNLLKSVFSALHDGCVGGDRLITAEKMAKGIAKASQSSDLLSPNQALASARNWFQIVPLQEVPAVIADEATGMHKAEHINFGSPNRIDALRCRYLLTLQRCLRSGWYRRGLPASGTHGDGILPLLRISSLDGIESGVVVGVLGLLSAVVGAPFLEDNKSRLELDFGELNEPLPINFLGELSLIIVVGRWTGAKFIVQSVRFPPSEDRTKSNTVFGPLDTFGLAPSDQQRAAGQESQMLRSVVAILAHVHLENSKCLAMLTKFFAAFEGRREDELAEMCFVLVGDFVSHSWSLGDIGHMGDQQGKGGYQQLLDQLATCIHQNAPSVGHHATFVLIPGPNDPTSSGALPQPPLSSSFLSANFKSRLKKCTFASNPCRLRFFTHEMIIARKNYFHDFHHAARKLPASSPLFQGNISIPQHDRVVATICDAAHLAPLDSNILWRFDAALQLNRLPHLMVLCDKTEQWQCNHLGSHIVNPGSFTSSGTFLWYTPCDREFSLNRVS